MLAEREDIGVHETLLQRLADARMQTDKLFQIVKPEALYDRPIPERHRIIFYLGHLEAFDWNLFHTRVSNLTVFDPALDKLFAFGIDPIDGRLPSDAPDDWPRQPQVEQYRKRVRAALDTALGRADFVDSPEGESPFVLMNVAIEHRLMHAETLAYMLHQLPHEKKLPQLQAQAPRAGRRPADMAAIPAGPVTLGLSREDTRTFGWDNEYEAQTVDVPAFKIDRYKVTNSEYLEFLEAGGYRDGSLWTAGGWEWKQEQGITHPIFWKPAGGRWLYRGMFEDVSLPLYWPVYVSHAEAEAYAAWIGKRLPTEAEWQRAASGTPEAPGADHGYFDFGRWDPFPVDAFPSNQSVFGVCGMVANGWEWTSSRFAPFSGFQPFSCYPGYSANFFDAKHFVLKGGSTRTDRSMLRPSFRNWFQPHYQYVYAGFRCAA